MTPTVGHTGPGPLSGTDAREAARIVMGECPRLPFLPELADRGIGADAVGRTGAMLADLPLDVSTRGWRLAGSVGRPARRAADLLDRDADALEEADEIARGVTVDRDLAREGRGRAGQEPASPAERRLQVRVLGPWSLAARLELPGGMPVLTDRGARRDLAASLAEGAAGYAGRLAGRLGAGARILLDEPRLWHVAAGTVAGPSRFDPVPAVPAEQLALSLCRFADALRTAGVAEVLVRAPGGAGPEAPARWAVVSEPPRGETPLDGLCVSAATLRAPGAGGPGAGEREADPATLDAARAAAHAALDAAGTVLGEGRLLHLEGLPGGGRTPRTGSEVEHAAVGVLDLLDRLAAPRYASLDRLVLTPTVGDVTTGREDAVAALAAVRRVAEAAPTVAE